jgi:hypothetical protein
MGMAVNHYRKFSRFAVMLVAAVVCMLVHSAYGQTGTAGSGAQVPPSRPPATGAEIRPKIDVNDAVNAIRDLIKKKEQEKAEKAKAASEAAAAAKVKAEAAAKADAAAVEVKTDIISNPKKTDVVVTPTVGKPTPKPHVVVKSAASKPIAPVATKTVLQPVPIAIPEPLPAPIKEPDVDPAAGPSMDVPVAPVMGEPPLREEASESSDAGWKLYAILVAIAGALAAAALAAKALLTPKASLDCTLGNATSRLISEPSVGIPDIAFAVRIPNAQAGVPTNIAFVG